MQDEYLSIAAVAGADADRGDLEHFRYFRCKLGGRASAHYTAGICGFGNIGSGCVTR